MEQMPQIIQIMCVTSFRGKRNYFFFWGNYQGRPKGGGRLEISFERWVGFS